VGNNPLNSTDPTGHVPYEGAAHEAFIDWFLGNGGASAGWVRGFNSPVQGTTGTGITPDLINPGTNAFFDVKPGGSPFAAVNDIQKYKDAGLVPQSGACGCPGGAFGKPGYPGGEWLIYKGDDGNLVIGHFWDQINAAVFQNGRGPIQLDPRFAGLVFYEEFTNSTKQVPQEVWDALLAAAIAAALAGVISVAGKTIGGILAPPGRQPGGARAISVSFSPVPSSITFAGIPVNLPFTINPGPGITIFGGGPTGGSGGGGSSGGCEQCNGGLGGPASGSSGGNNYDGRDGND
jgi:hypothetical protein